MFNRVQSPEQRPVDQSGDPTRPPGFANGAYPPPGRPAPYNGAPAVASATSTPKSVLGADIGVAGQRVIVVTRSSLLIAGALYGDVTGDEITVADTGQVSGAITARSIIVHGQVNGVLRAANVMLMPSAKVEGEIVKQVLVISEGAHFDGNVRRARDAAEITPNLDFAIPA